MPHSYCLGSLQKSPPESPRPIYDFLCPSTFRGFQPRGLTSRAAPPHQWEAGVGGLNTSTSPPLSGKLWGVSYTVSQGGPQWVLLRLPTAVTWWLYNVLWPPSFGHLTFPLPTSSSWGSILWETVPQGIYPNGVKQHHFSFFKVQKYIEILGVQLSLPFSLTYWWYSVLMSNIVFHFCCSSFNMVLPFANKLSVSKLACKFNILCGICPLFVNLRYPVSRAALSVCGYWK